MTACMVADSNTIGILCSMHEQVMPTITLDVMHMIKHATCFLRSICRATEGKTFDRGWNQSMYTIMVV